MAAIPAPKPLQMPSDMRAQKGDVHIPKYMRFRQQQADAGKDVTAVPSYIDGVKPTDAVRRPLVPKRRVSKDGAEADAAEDVERDRDVRRRRRAAANPFASNGKASTPAARVMGDVRTKSLQQLRAGRHTAASVSSVLAADEAPLAARGSMKVFEEQRVCGWTRARVIALQSLSRLLCVHGVTCTVRWLARSRVDAGGAAADERRTEALGDRQRHPTSGSVRQGDAYAANDGAAHVPARASSGRRCQRHLVQSRGRQ